MPDNGVPRLSMNSLTTFRWSLDEDLHYCEQAGYTGIGVWRRKLEDFGDERAFERLAESPLRVSNLMWAGGFTGNDGRTLDEAVDDATRAIELAQAIDAGCLVVHTGGRNYHTRRHAGRLVRSALEDLLPVAEARGVTLAVEPMPPACAEEWTVLTSLEAASDLIDEFSSEALRIVFDTYSFAEATPATIRAIAPRVALVCLADRSGPATLDQHRLPLGAGDAPLGAIVKAFCEGGFDGFFDVKLLGAGFPPGGYAKLLERSAAFAARLIEGARVPQPQFSSL